MQSNKTMDTEQQTKTLPTRAEIPAEMKWNVESIFADDAAWEEAYQECADLLEKAPAFAGTLGKGPRELLAFFQYQTDFSQKLDKVFLYAAMKKDEDNGNATYQGLKERAEGLAIKANAALALSLIHIYLAKDEAPLWLKDTASAKEADDHAGL